MVCVKPIPELFACSTLAKVAAGDSCASLVEQYNTTFYGLMNSNGQLDCGNLQPGQQICVQTLPLSCTSTHYVESQTTCEEIANASNISTDELLFYNPHINCNSIAIHSSVCTSVAKLRPMDKINIQLASAVVLQIQETRPAILKHYNMFLEMLTRRVKVALITTGR
jgi:hypothetical protein